jgi:hypothetical protein
MSHIVLIGRWCHIIFLNVHAPTEEESYDSKEGVYERLAQVFEHFLKYHMKVILGNLNTKFWREGIFKLTFGNGRLHEDSNNNGVRAVNFAT